MANAMSLEKSVRSCSVNVGESNRIQSDRFFNPSNMVCIPWNGLNNKGQLVSPDSFYTKTPGCDSAEDRVMVENAQRPNYMSYVTLGAQGIQGNIYGNMDAQVNAQARDGTTLPATSENNSAPTLTITPVPLVKTVLPPTNATWLKCRTNSATKPSWLVVKLPPLTVL